MDSNLTMPIKYAMFPVKRNTLFIRFENIADNLDYWNYTQNDTTVYIKVREFAQSLFEHVNHGVNLQYINIVETSLTGNQAYSDMKANKVHWYGVDDD